jgi:hypothetical protein
MARIRRAFRQGGTDHIWGLALEGRSGGVGFGLILIGIGVVLWMEQQGLMPPGFWRSGWPWILIILSAVQLVTARTASRIGSAVFFGLIGGWFLLVLAHWHGFTWWNAWPLTLVAAGASTLAQAVAGMFLPERTPKHVVIDGVSGEEGRHDA